MKYFFLLFVLLVATPFVSAQSITDDFRTNEIENASDIIKPNTLSTHPLGINVSRINHNFKIRSPEKYSFSFGISSGNVFLPYVKSYELTDPIDRQTSASIPWHVREFQFNLNEVPSKTREFVADGVIRSYDFAFNLPLSANHELSFELHSYSLDKGKYPFSLVTSDKSIEWFHSNIAGGDDPFSRKHYGFDKAGISYKDENNNLLEIKDGDFKISGIQINYFYYPKLEINKKNNIYFNFGTHLGVNTTRYNPVADIGISSSAIKKIVLQNKNILTLGLSSGALRQRFIQFGNRVNFNDRLFLYSFEGLVNYKKKLKNNNYISYGINYTFQTSYEKKKDFDYIVLTGERIKTHWQQTFYHLYENLQGWNVIFTYSVKQLSYFVYLREDLKLDNSPDLQTGIGVKMAILR